MTLVVEPAGEEDINAIFPRNMTKEGEENAIQRCQYLIKVSPAVKWEKCTDTVTGEIIGGAMWIICENAKPPDSDLDGPPGTWENETEKRYAQAL
ncbi:hypothetical protein M501DRAFT_998238 [Patellaria atrata CBS 101060]|uniref:Uncharacterized protein n=1 Tax=Patellaria atrata CBS 101060 TaxID=1346257 RepID=A0A9P4SG14_9PEZI|nr:hypothetical protein M501DRAFT_998238 [Patellaria atrata CBS 101060]